MMADYNTTCIDILFPDVILMMISLRFHTEKFSFFVPLEDGED
jgi:hypothetical protein